MVKWSCASVLCYNNYKTKDVNGEAIKYYRLPADENIRLLYGKMFKTSGINWSRGHICGAHWVTGERKSSNDIPEIAVPEDQLQKITEKYHRARNLLKRYKNPPSAIKTRYNAAKRKFEAASKISTNISTPSTDNTNLDCEKKPRKKYRKLSPSQYESKILTLKSEVDKANNTIEKLKEELQSAKRELKKSKSIIVMYKNKASLLQGKLNKANNNMQQFKFDIITKSPSNFHYLCGLSIGQFNIILNCAREYTHLIPYPDSAVGHSERRSVDLATELLSVLTVCRHGLHQGIMAFMLGKSTSTMQ